MNKFFFQTITFKLVKHVDQDIVIIMKDKQLRSSRPILKDDSSMYNSVTLKKSERIMWFQSLVLSLEKTKKESEIDEESIRTGHWLS